MSPWGAGLTEEFRRACILGRWEDLAVTVKAAAKHGLPEMTLRKNLAQGGAMTTHAYTDPAAEAYTQQLPMMKQDFPRLKYDEEGNSEYVTKVAEP